MRASKQGCLSGGIGARIRTGYDGDFYRGGSEHPISGEKVGGLERESTLVVMMTFTEVDESDQLLVVKWGDWSENRRWL